MPKTNIKLYGADWCVYCKNAQKWLDNEGIEYTFKDIEVSENKNHLNELNVSGIPFFEVTNEGSENVHLHGFAPDQLLKAIK